MAKTKQILNNEVTLTEMDKKNGKGEVIRVNKGEVKNGVNKGPHIDVRTYYLDADDELQPGKGACIPRFLALDVALGILEGLDIQFNLQEKEELRVKAYEGGEE